MKTLKLELKSSEGRELNITLPNQDLESLIGIDEDFKIVSTSDVNLVLNVIKDRDKDSIYALNDLLSYTNMFKNDTVYNAFVAAQAVLTNLDMSIDVILNKKYEFFPDVYDMGDVARYLVKDNRIFKNTVPSDVLPYLNYEKIGESISKGGYYFTTELGIISILE